MHKAGVEVEVVIVLFVFNMVLLAGAYPGDRKNIIATTSIFSNTTDSSTNTSRPVAIAESSKKTRTRILFGSNSRQDVEHSQEIIFPDEFELLEKIPKLGNTPRCNKTAELFCEEIDSYPEFYVRNLIEHNHLNSDLFKFSNVLPSDVVSDDIASDGIVNRNAGIVEDFVCATRRQLIFPKAAKNKYNKWKYIINEEVEEYKQGIFVEKCVQTDGPCKMFGASPEGYTFHCKQKFITRRLVALADNGQPIPDLFLMPSACCCAFRKDITFLSKFGAMQTSYTSPDLQ